MSDGLNQQYTLSSFFAQTKILLGSAVHLTILTTLIRFSMLGDSITLHSISLDAAQFVFWVMMAQSLILFITTIVKMVKTKTMPHPNISWAGMGYIAVGIAMSTIISAIF